MRRILPWVGIVLLTGCQDTYLVAPPGVAKELEAILVAASNGSKQDYGERFMMVCGATAGVLIGRGQADRDGSEFLGHVDRRLRQAGFRARSARWGASERVPTPPSVNERNIAPVVVMVMPKVDALMKRRSVSSRALMHSVVATATDFLADELKTGNVDDVRLTRVLPFFVHTAALAQHPDKWKAGPGATYVARRAD